MRHLRRTLATALCACALLVAACDSNALGPDPDPWDDASWQALAEGIAGAVYTMAEHRGDLYVGGFFEAAAGVQHILRWDGAGWRPVGTGVNNIVRALASFGDDLVALGQFDEAGGIPAHRAARWAGASWQPTDGNLVELCCRPQLAVRGDELYASGRFPWEHGVMQGLAKWDGSHWNLLSVQVGSSHPVSVPPFAVHGGHLVIRVLGSNLAANLARWNGSAWSWMGVVPGAPDRLVSVGDELYAIGRVAHGEYVVARSTGSDWQEVGTVFGALYAAVAHEGSLVVGGAFEGEDAGSVLRLTRQGWQVIDAEADGTVVALASHGRSLAAAGSFTSIGGVAAAGIAVLRLD